MKQFHMFYASTLFELFGIASAGSYAFRSDINAAHTTSAVALEQQLLEQQQREIKNLQTIVPKAFALAINLIVDQNST